MVQIIDMKNSRRKTKTLRRISTFDLHKSNNKTYSLCINISTKTTGGTAKNNWKKKKQLRKSCLKREKPTKGLAFCVYIIFIRDTRKLCSFSCQWFIPKGIFRSHYFRKNTGISSTTNGTWKCWSTARECWIDALCKSIVFTIISIFDYAKHNVELIFTIHSKESLCSHIYISRLLFLGFVGAPSLPPPLPSSSLCLRI